MCSDDTQLYMGAISNGHDAWKVTLDVCGRNTQFKIDTGADITAICEQTYQLLHPPPRLSPVTTRLAGPGGAVQCIGKFHTQVRDHQIDIYVIKSNNNNNLLGREDAVQLGLVKRLEEIKRGYEDVFGDLGLYNGDPVHIKLKETAAPYSVATPRRIPFPIHNKVKQELERMCSLGVIKPVSEPTPWCAPMVPVIKKNGKVRICVDLRRLNTAVERERYILPTLEDISPKLANDTLFSTLDASSGFWQIPLDEESSRLTTFSTPFGRFCSRRSPVASGLCITHTNGGRDTLCPDRKGTSRNRMGL